MRSSPIAIAVAAAFLSFGAVAEDKAQQAPADQTRPMNSSGGASKQGKVEDHRNPQGSAAAGSSVTEQKPENPPAPPRKVEEKKY